MRGSNDYYDYHVELNEQDIEGAKKLTAGRTSGLLKHVASGLTTCVSQMSPISGASPMKRVIRASSVTKHTTINNEKSNLPYVQVLKFSQSARDLNPACSWESGPSKVARSATQILLPALLLGRACAAFPRSPAWNMPSAHAPHSQSLQPTVQASRSPQKRASPAQNEGSEEEDRGDWLACWLCTHLQATQSCNMCPLRPCSSLPQAFNPHLFLLSLEMCAFSILADWQNAARGGQSPQNVPGGCA